MNFPGFSQGIPPFPAWGAGIPVMKVEYGPALAEPLAVLAAAGILALAIAAGLGLRALRAKRVQPDARKLERDFDEAA
jgi:hypothetical protein